LSAVLVGPVGVEHTMNLKQIDRVGLKLREESLDGQVRVEQV